eukprot:1329132-Amorphochlora_amoeboformis.AAC.1
MEFLPTGISKGRRIYCPSPSSRSGERPGGWGKDVSLPSVSFLMMTTLPILKLLLMFLDDPVNTKGGELRRNYSTIVANNPTLLQSSTYQPQNPEIPGFTPGF